MTNCKRLRDSTLGDKYGYPLINAHGIPLKPSFAFSEYDIAVAEYFTKNRLHTKGALQCLLIDRGLFDQYLYTLGLNKMPSAEHERQRLKMDGEKRSPSRYKFITLTSEGWRYPPEPFYTLSDAKTARHLCACETYGIRGSWSHDFLTRWIDIDIDHPKGGQKDPRIQTLTHFFLPNQYLIQYRPQSGNYSILLRCEPVELFYMQHYMNRLMVRLGLQVKDGFIEIYPHTQRGRRLPLGDQEVYTIYPSTFSKTLSATNQVYNDFILSGHIPPERYPVGIYKKADQLQAFVNLSPIRPQWIAKRLTQLGLLDKEDKKNQRKKRTNKKKTNTLGRSTSNQKNPQALTIRQKLHAPATRYHTETRFIRTLYGMNSSESEAYQILSKWYINGGTNGYSQEWDHQKDYDGVLCRLKLHIHTFYKWLDEKGGQNTVIRFDTGLTKKDIRKILQVCSNELHMSEWLYDLLLWAKARRPYIESLYLSSEVARSFKNGRDWHTKWLPHLTEKGIISIINEKFKPHNRSRTFSVNWRFEDGKQFCPSVAFRTVLIHSVPYSRIQVLKHTIKGQTHTISRWTVWRLANEHHPYQRLYWHLLPPDITSSLTHTDKLKPQPHSSPYRKAKSNKKRKVHPFGDSDSRDSPQTPHPGG